MWSMFFYHHKFVVAKLWEVFNDESKSCSFVRFCLYLCFTWATSYVLKALRVEEELAHTSLRIGLGRFTSEDDVLAAVEQIVAEVKRLRSLSPLWEMAQEGVDLRSKIKWAALILLKGK